MQKWEKDHSGSKLNQGREKLRLKYIRFWFELDKISGYMIVNLITLQLQLPFFLL